MRYMLIAKRGVPYAVVVCFYSSLGVLEATHARSTVLRIPSRMLYHAICRTDHRFEINSAFHEA